jgi:hypothetical protein
VVLLLPLFEFIDAYAEMGTRVLGLGLEDSDSNSRLTHLDSDSTRS